MGLSNDGSIQGTCIGSGCADNITQSAPVAGVFTSSDDTCVAVNGDGSGVRAQAMCCSFDTSIEIKNNSLITTSIECNTKWSNISGSSDNDEAYVSCGDDYFLANCASLRGDIGSNFNDGNYYQSESTCVASNGGGSDGVYAQSLCCQYQYNKVDLSILDNNPEINCNYGVLEMGAVITLLPEGVCSKYADFSHLYPDFEIPGPSVMMTCDYSSGSGQGLLNEYDSDDCSGVIENTIIMDDYMYECIAPRENTCTYSVGDGKMYNIGETDCTTAVADNVVEYEAVNILVDDCFSTINGLSFTNSKTGNNSVETVIYSDSNCTNLLYSSSAVDEVCYVDSFGFSYLANISFVEQSVDESIFENNPQVNCNYGALNFGEAVGLVPENVCLDGDVGEAYDDWNVIASSAMVVCEYPDGVGRGFLKGYTS